MSTSSAIQVEEVSAWKEEVSRKLQARKTQKGRTATERPSPSEAHASRRAMEAAARVAARFAKAPSYSQVLAEEARAAVRAAEAASQAAQQAQAAAASVLASLEANLEGNFEADLDEDREAAPLAVVGVADPAEPELFVAPSIRQEAATEAARYAVQWDRELPLNRMALGQAETVQRNGWQEGLETGWQDEGAQDGASVEIVEGAQPIHANLIEFPRELVAARKVRPRLAEGPMAVEAQLSIFEVDPGSISTEPDAAESTPEPVTPAWSGPEWSRIELDDMPAEEPAQAVEPRAATASTIELAEPGRRILALLVDGSLIVGAFLAAAMTAATNAKGMPGPRVVEMATVVGLLGITAVYKTLFSVLASATPGMKYAGITLATFSGGRPTRAERCNRLMALLLSVLPVGLGVMWSIFDEEHLSWHDRLSRTYLKRQ